jgi:flagellar hook-associated protein 3 FlgL
MRVSDGMVQDLGQRAMSSARARSALATSIAASGMRVQKPSDDPVAFALGRRDTAREQVAIASERTSDYAMSVSIGADQALAEAGDALARARELAVQMSNGTYTANERTFAASAARELRLEVINAANREVDGTYVFGGYRDGAPPFDPTTGAYTGDGLVKQVEVAPFLRLPVSVSGATTFGAGTGTDVLATLEALATALDTNDPAAVQALLPDIDTSAQQINGARVDLGGQIRGFEVTKSTAGLVQERSAASRAQQIEADPFRAYSDLLNAERALQGAVSVVARLPFPGLVGGR